MYQAQHYLIINGVHYAPGDEIKAALSPAQEQRFLRLGAICACDAPIISVPVSAPAPAPAADSVIEDAAPEPDAPMIDVMDGIVKPKKGKRK